MKERSKLSKITAVVLALSVVAGAATGIISNALASGVPSLDYIEEIKSVKNAEGSSFRILEVAPEASQSSMGYYAEGYEPVSGWLSTVASLTPQSSRTGYANNLFSSLSGAGLLGTGNTTPLESNGAYTEYYPWQVTDFDSVNELTIENTEEIPNINGRFVEDSNGDYMVDTEYSLPSLFSPEEWFADLSANHYGNSGMNRAGTSVVYSAGDIVVNTTSAANGADCYSNHSWGNGDTSFYKIPCEPNTKYKMTYTVNIEGDGGAQIFFFEYGENYTETMPNPGGASWGIATSDYQTRSGNYVKTFTTSANTHYLGFRCGTYSVVDTTATFSDIILVKDSAPFEGADAVQDPDYFYYGDAAASKNIFSLYDYYENFDLYQSAPYFENGTYGQIEFDYLSNTLKFDGQVQMPFPSSWNLTDAQNDKCYLVEVSPNEGYTFTYTVKNEAKTDGAYTQSIVRLVGFSQNGNASYVEAFDSDSGTYSVDFTTGSDIKYVIVLLGSNNADTVSSFSNVFLYRNTEAVDISGEFYYYDVLFTEIESTEGLAEGQIVYEKVTEENKDFGEIVGTYKVAGPFYSNGTGVIIDEYSTYYTAALNPDVGPQIYFDAAHPYRTPRVSSYHIAEDDEIPYFVSDSGIGTFMGRGKGSYKLDQTKVGNVTVRTDTVYYTGGFTNNNWFKYRVLDAHPGEDDGFPVTVTTVTPDKLDEYIGFINYYDLVVFTSGTKVDGSSSTYTKDISAAFMAKYGASGETPYFDLHVPTMYDKAITGNSSTPANLKTFLNYIATESGRSGASTGWVSQYIYCFSASDISASTSNMANKNFSVNVTDSLYINEGSAYNDVYAEIVDENFIRNSVAPPVGNLPLEASEATSIRYILNFKGQRVVMNKDTLNILDIEPYTSGKVYKSGVLKAISELGYAYNFGHNPDVSTVSAAEKEKRKVLDEQQFYSWFPSTSLTNGKLSYRDPDGNIQYLKINIVTMAVNEVIASGEDIAEAYDLVYIGDSTFNMQTKLQVTGRAAGTPGKQPYYNDESMNGMYYTSTGDIMTTNARDIWAEGTLGGIVYDDYNWFSIFGSKPYAFLKGWTEFTNRSSGNDLTAVKEEQLENLMEAGLPVVVANDLASGFNTALQAKCEVKSEFKFRKERNTWWNFLLRKKPFYHIKIYAWLEGLPAELHANECVQAEWYFVKKGTTTPIPLGNSSSFEAYQSTQSGAVVANTYEIGSTTVNGKKGVHVDDVGWCIDIDDIADWQGQFYAKLTVGNTDYSVINGTSLKTNKVDTALTTRTIYVRGERVQGIEQRNDAGDRELKEVRRSGVTSDPFEFYLPSGQSASTWWYIVGYYTNKNYDVNSRTTIPVDNLWHYRGVGDVAYEIEDNKGEGYRYSDYLKEGKGKGELNPGGTPDGRGYDYITYTDQNGDKQKIRVGTPNWDCTTWGLNHKNKWTIQTRYLNVTLVSAEGQVGGFGAPSGMLYADANVSSIAVDNSSYMFKFLNYAFNGDPDKGIPAFYGKNLFAERDFEAKPEKKADLVNYIGLSCPKIVANEDSVKAYPEQITNNTIEIQFAIQNSTDVKVATTRYQLNFYVDLNSDGKFKEDELTDCTVEQAYNGGSFYQIAKTALRASTKTGTYTYKMYRQLPSDYTGILPWKIEIIKLDDNGTIYNADGSINYDNLHDSYQNYAYIRPESASVINVLQVLPSDWDWTYRASGKTDGNLYYGTVFASPEFKNLLGVGKNWFVEEGTGPDFIFQNNNVMETRASDTYYMMFGPTNESGEMEDYSAYYQYYKEHNGKMAGYGGLVPDFFVILQCINVKDLNAKYGGIGDWDGHNGYQIRNYTEDFIDQYNMLILGFADNWGKAGRINLGSLSTNVGLNMGSAFAIHDYIDSGKAVLLTHDTTTVYNNFPNNLILSTGINAANTVADWLSSGLNWLGNLFGGDNFINKAANWLGSLDLTADERERNGYWINLLRDVCGLDRYGVTYSIKEKAKSHAADKWVCQGVNCGFESYSQVTTCPNCGSNCVKQNVYAVADWTLQNGYYNDGNKGHGENIYTTATENRQTLAGDGYYYDTSISNMLANDYSISYVPGTNRTQTDKYVGGYTRHTLARYNQNTKLLPTLTMWSSEDEVYRSTRITQTNKGQITCYPYDINIYKLDDNGNKIIDENGGYEFDENGTMTVKETHDQVYQLNMNGDDVSCWYCMSGDEYADIPNDALNNYFIYSRKNITYTGAGHTNQFTAMEAKLFANTLIAAYRPSAEPATAEFVNSDDEYNDSYRSTGYILLTSATQQVGANNAQTDQKIMNEEVHFKLNNKNLANVSNSRNFVQVDLSYSYVIEETDTEGNLVKHEYKSGDTGVPSINMSNVTLYYGTNIATAEGNAKNWTNLTENGKYVFEVPEEVINALKKEGVTEVKLYITPITFYGSEKLIGSTDVITIRLLGLRGIS